MPFFHTEDHHALQYHRSQAQPLPYDSSESLTGYYEQKTEARQVKNTDPSLPFKVSTELEQKSSDSSCLSLTTPLPSCFPPILQAKS